MIRGVPDCWGFIVHTGERISVTGESKMAGSDVFTMVGSTTFAARFSNNPVNRVEELIGMKSAISLILAKRRVEAFLRTLGLGRRPCCPNTNFPPRRREKERVVKISLN